MASRCSRSVPTRARRSSTRSPSVCRAGAARSRPDLAGPAARGSRSRARLTSAPPGPPASVGPAVRHHRRVPDIVTPDPILPIRLIALDIDGTLVGDDLVIGPRHAGGDPGGPRPRRPGLPGHRPDGLERDAVRARARPRPRRSSATRARSSARCRPPDSTRLGRLLVHTPLPADVAREIVAWTRAHGLDPHLNHLERFIVRADDPRADDYSAFMGAAAELVDDLSRRSATRSPRSWRGEPPLPTELAPLARAAFAGSRRRHGQPSALPRVRRAGRLQGPRRPLAGAPARRPAGCRPGHRRPVERPRDAGRGRARRGDADARRPRSRPSPGTSPRRWRRGRRPDDRGARPGAGPREARARVGRGCAGEASRPGSRARRPGMTARVVRGRRTPGAPRPSRRSAPAASSRCRPTRSTGSPSRSTRRAASSGCSR